MQKESFNPTTKPNAGAEMPEIKPSPKAEKYFENCMALFCLSMAVAALSIPLSDTLALGFAGIGTVACAAAITVGAVDMTRMICQKIKTRGNER